MAHAIGFERPDHGDLVEANAEFGGQRIVDAEVVERLPHVEVALAASDDAELGVGRVDHHAVELVGAAVGQRCVELLVEQARFLVERRVGPADVEAAGRQFVIGRDDDAHAVRRDVDRGRGFDRVGQRLEGHPATGVARQRPAVQAEVEVFLHSGWRQHRHHRRLEGVFGLVCDGG